MTINNFDLQFAVDKVLDFAEFFLSLGDMKQIDLLIAIENRDPDFADYFTKLTEPVGSAIDFFRIYTDWAISKIREEYENVWCEIKDICASSERYNMLKMQFIESTVLWGVLEHILRNGVEK